MQRFSVISTSLAKLLVLYAAVLTSIPCMAANTTLKWTEPTQNTDGSALTNLGEYELHYGCTDSGQYEAIRYIPAAVTSEVVGGLPDGATCYFAMKAVTTEGIKSVFSNEASKTFAALLPGVVLNLVVAVNADAAWYDDRPRDIIVAVIDSGVDCSQFDCVPGYDFVDNDTTAYSPANPHGTNTAGILADFENVKIMPLRVLNDSGVSTEQRLVDAINFAKDNGADLIQGIILVSAAWSIPGYDQPGQFQALCDAIDNSGLLYVGVTGNEGVNLSNVTRYPPACNSPNMIVVAGSDQSDSVFTSFPGDIVAPGNDINLRTGGTGSGASYAAPQVAATAVLELRHNPELSALELRAEVLEHVGGNGVLNTYYGTKVYTPPEPPEPSGCTGSEALCVEAIITIADINSRNPIQSKQGFGERGYVFEVPAGTAPRVLTLENWPAGAASPTMVRGNTTLSAGTTHNVRVTHDGTTARLYLDGALDGELVTPPPRNNSQPVRDCAYIWSSAYQQFFSGSCSVQ